MNTDLVIQFRTVFESGTIARAAEALHMTPGALSRSLKRLESELGCNLFLPSGRNIVPTKEAANFYSSSTEILKSIEDAKNNLKHIRQEKREIKIATFEVFSTHFSGWMIEHLNIDIPFTIFEATPSYIENKILDGLADIGITYIPELHPDLDHLPIADMSMGVFVSSKHKNEDLPFAIPITELGINYLQAKTLDGWPADTYRKIGFKFEMLETALDLASRGKCKIFCPKFIVKIENERLKEKFQLIELDEKIRLPKMKVFLVKKKSLKEDQVLKKINKAIRTVISL
jgi:DNA-binding transcriptional LysR family regulator